MGGRKGALWRLVLLIPLFLIVYFLSALIALFLLAWFIVDIVWTLATGGEGLSPDGWGGRIYSYPVDNTRYVVLGDGEWRWLP